MGLARSTFYDQPLRLEDDTALVEAMHGIKDEFEAYGWRRMQAALAQQGWVVNHKKIKRLMKAHDLTARCHGRYISTTDSDHDQPIFPNLARDLEIVGLNQLWVSDMTYGAPRPGRSGVHMTEMLKGKEEDGDSLALCCEGA
jgi:putative transposase